jgi:HD-GYP domain-containing protein (c-di-GMP phosphodiesterase class II)
MTAARPYRMTPLTTEQALTELRKFGGVQFDPDVVEAFFKTNWARGPSDSEADEARDVPLIGHNAGALTGPGRNPGAA